MDFLSLTDIVKKLAKLSKRERHNLKTQKVLLINVKKILFLIEDGCTIKHNFERSLNYLIEIARGVCFDFQSLVTQRLRTNQLDLFDRLNFCENKAE